ncbi:hypothetical protein P3S68_031904 [Capsicum galapagoense]
MEIQKVLKAFVDDLVRDSIKQMKDSISKDLTEFRLMLLDVLVSWREFGGLMVQAEHYFNFYKIKEDQKLTVASFYLDGEALEWYQWLLRNNQLIDWPHFADKVRIRFKQKGLEFAGGRLANLKHVASVTENQSRFEAISSSFGKSGVLLPYPQYVHPYKSNTTTTPLPQCYDEKSEPQSKIDVHKVLDESFTNGCPTVFAETRSQTSVECLMKQLQVRIVSQSN